MFCICHFVLIFANPSRSCINYIRPVISAFVIVEIYFVTPLACSRLREGSQIVESPKLRKRQHENVRKLGTGRAAPTPTPFHFFPILRSYFRLPFTYASFLLSERLEYAWINCARKMAYSACRQYSQKSLILLKILLGPFILLQILLGIPKHFRTFRKGAWAKPLKTN